MTYIAVLVGPRLRAGDVCAVDAVRAAVLEVLLEKREALFGRVGHVVVFRVQDDIGVSRLVGGVTGLEMLAGEWGRGCDGGADKDEDGGQLHFEWLRVLEIRKRWVG